MLVVVHTLLQASPSTQSPSLGALALYATFQSASPPRRAGPSPALNLVRFALWTLRDKAAQRRLALR